MSPLKNEQLFLAIAFLTVLILPGCVTDKKEKTIAVIEKLDLVNNKLANYQFQIETLEFQVSEGESKSIDKLKNQLTKSKLTDRLVAVFNETFSEEEINDLYVFLNSSAYEKLFNSSIINNATSEKFKDINDEIERLENTVDKPEPPTKKKFEPILVTNKKNGIYETIEYVSGMRNEDIKLLDSPAVTSDDFKIIEKVISNHGPLIEITLTKKGSKSFYQVTKRNIGEPLAIVVENKIVSMPTVNMPIMGGKINISGNYTENEVDEIIRLLKK